jgi:hypothetical protein
MLPRHCRAASASLSLRRSWQVRRRKGKRHNGSAQLVATEMTVPYAKAEEERAPADVVLVCVGEAGAATHGHECGAVLAMVKWRMVVPGENLRILRCEGPFDVGTALDYADEIAHLFGLSRVMVVIGGRARRPAERRG